MDTFQCPASHKGKEGQQNDIRKRFLIQRLKDRLEQAPQGSGHCPRPGRAQGVFGQAHGGILVLSHAGYELDSIILMDLFQPGTFCVM